MWSYLHIDNYCVCDFLKICTENLFEMKDVENNLFVILNVPINCSIILDKILSTPLRLYQM